MKYLFYLSTFLFSSWMMSCHQTNPMDSPSSSNRLDAKHFPSEWFFMQRSYPDQTFDLKAYEQGLQEARYQVAARGGDDATGFNAAWTVQGPGNIGARINTIAVHPFDESIIYVGFSQGGVWKTVDAGTTWNPIFDDQLFLAIADIVIDASNPEVIWVGTGDQNISGYPFIGDGIYKSEDGGSTWTHKGLTDQRIISKIILDPDNSDILYAATMGLPFERNSDRGLYKTSDGGISWQQILYLDDGAGIIDLVMDPFDNQTLYASGWDRVRNNQESIIWGPNANIFKTTDGGLNWEQLEGGLPISDEMGRTGLAISQITPGLVYAMFVGSNSQLYGIYRSEDGGGNWNAMNIDEDQTGLNDNALGGFGWYFGQIRTHPTDDNILFLLGVDIWMNLDNAIWSSIAPPWWEYSVHADKHDLVFSNSGTLFLATDGGLYKTLDLGLTWDDIENIPTTQFYRVAYNPHQPDLYYGGAQDNGTTGGNAANINDWSRIYGGDGFQAAFHPDNPDVFYAEWQNGNIVVTENGGIDWSPATDGLDPSDRKHWDMPYMISQHDPDVLYAGTDRLYRSSNGIYPFFEPISDNLTDTDSLLQRYHNITTLHESPLNPDLLYVGTGDGNVWRTDDGGNNWEHLSEDLPERYVTDIKASPDMENWVYVTHSGYRDNDFIPRLHRSENQGETWQNLSAGLPNLAINDIYIIPQHADSVLFVATDGGVYGSLDAGNSWERLGCNMPIVPVYDLEWNPEHNELVAGTFARSIMSFPIDSLFANPKPPDTVAQVPPAPAPTLADLKIHPNPATDFITLSFSNNEPGKSVEVVLVNAVGQLMSQQQSTQFGALEMRFDVSDFAAGTYFVKVKTRHHVRSEAFTILR